MKIPLKMTQVLSHVVFKTQENSPALLFGVGIVGIVGSTILACRATLKVEDIIDVHDDKLEMVSNSLAYHADEYSERDALQDKVILYTNTTMQIVKIYAPAVLVGALSIAALTYSHRTLTRRNVALTAAYATVQKALDDYRHRVRNELGEEKERDIYYDLEACEIDDEEKPGKKKKIQVPGDPQMYARVFDTTNKNWNRIPDWNYSFLKIQQNFLNDRLISRGHVFLNEVYDALGFDHTKPGSVVGWLYPGKNGDGFIDFGSMQTTRNGIFLDFNVDGVIYNQIKE